MTFFIPSAGPGDGANLGGLAGADRHCKALAAAVGAGDHTWRAYLSTQADGDSPAINDPPIKDEARKLCPYAVDR